MVSAGREVTYPKVREACTREHTKDQTIQCKEVRMRLFYNSQVSKRNVESLLARGNKRRSLQHGKKVHGNRFETSTTDLKCVKNINSKTAHKVRSHADIVVSPVLQKYVQKRDGKVRRSENSVAPVQNHQECGGVITPNPNTKAEVGENELNIGVTNNGEQTDMSKQDKVLLFDINGCDDKFLNVTGKKKLEELLCVKGETNVQIFNQWRAQSDFDFGFVPLSDFIMLPISDIPAHCVIEPFALHKHIKDSGQMNFLGCRIPVASQFNLQAWQEMLEGYWDTQLIQLLAFGFPLDYNRNFSLSSDRNNHASAVQFPDHVDAYLKDEIAHGAILGPFTKNPIEKCHYSPFLTREKSGSDKRHVIVDLSWPQGLSVNAGIDKNSYLGTDFALTFPSVDHITSELTRLGTGAHLYKIDISRAFHHVKLDPSDYDLLGLSWNDVTYVDTCLPFGARHRTQIFQRISDAIHFGMRQRGYSVINYVDDFVGIGTPSVASASYHCLLDLLRRLGLDVSQKKLCPPSTKAICLGVEIDMVRRTIAIPDEKLQRICEMVDEWSTKRFCSIRQLQSLLGHLMYIQKCVRPSRFFVNRILELLRSNYDARSVTLNHDFRRDIRWFQVFLRHFNGTAFYDHKPIQEVLVWVVDVIIRSTISPLKNTIKTCISPN